MAYFTYFIVVFAIIQLFVSLANFVFYSGIRKANKGVDDQSKSLVSVLIPARNEEKNIANLLADLQLQDYKNIEILVFDDLSTDNTSQIVSRLMQSDSRIRLIKSEGLPSGWLGKNFGCFSMAKVARGDFFLFLDADVRINSDVIVNTVSQLKVQKLGLLSIFPKQIMVSWGEKFAIPNMNFILLSLLPLVLVRKSKEVSLAAANGQFMLFDSHIYRKFEPHQEMKANKVEDIEIARYYKSNYIGVACLVGNDTITCRMYEGFNDAVNGFSKNVVSFFGNSFVFAILFWLITTFGFFVVAFTMPIFVTLSYFAVFLITRILISIISRQHVFDNLVLIIPQQLALGLFIHRAIINQIKKQYQWKGRSIS